MTDLATSADILLRATARARSFHGKTFVIKLGGSAMEDPAATAGTLDSIATLHQLGLQLILVHGGGKPIDRAMAAANIPVKKVLGRRYTDAATLEVVRTVLREINLKLIDEFKQRRVDTFGYFNKSKPEKDSASMYFRRLTLNDNAGNPQDLGYVGGELVRIDDSLYDDEFGNGSLAILASIGMEEGTDQWLNINADSMAAALAKELPIKAVLFLTDTPGVLRDRNDPASLLPRLTVAECKQLIADKIIDGGMIPKVEACFEALDAGAGKAVILDGRNPHSLLSLVLSDTLTGTEITQ